MKSVKKGVKRKRDKKTKISEVWNCFEIGMVLLCDNLIVIYNNNEKPEHMKCALKRYWYKVSPKEIDKIIKLLEDKKFNSKLCDTTSEFGNYVTFNNFRNLNFSNKEVVKLLNCSPNYIDFRFIKNVKSTIETLENWLNDTDSKKDRYTFNPILHNFFKIMEN
jgi:hypothetical protein